MSINEPSHVKNRVYKSLLEVTRISIRENNEAEETVEMVSQKEKDYQMRILAERHYYR